LADKLSGSGLANDTILGGAGADSLYGGGSTNDIMTGGAGADTYWFGAGDGADTITEAAGTSDNRSDAVAFYSLNFNQLTFARTATNDLKITVNAAQGYSDNVVLANWGGYMDDTTTAGSTRINRINTFITNDVTFGLGLGTASADTLYGTTATDYIQGLAGADYIDGKGGADALYGGDGADTIVYTSNANAWLDGGNDTNTLTAYNATAGVTIDLTSNRLLNFTNLVGSSLADKLGGTSLAETISGGAGADSIWGAAGADLLAGGSGADSYWFGIGDGADTIATDTTNNADSVMFYGPNIGGGGIASTVLSGSNLIITMTSGDSLTLADWNLGGGNKLNRFNFDTGSGAGTYSLAVDSSNVATWTRLTS